MKIFICIILRNPDRGRRTKVYFLLALLNMSVDGERRNKSISKYTQCINMINKSISVLLTLMQIDISFDIKILRDNMGEK